MCWSRRGANRLLQPRCAALNSKLGVTASASANRATCYSCRQVFTYVAARLNAWATLLSVSPVHPAG
jgi:hypothetical protein